MKKFLTLRNVLFAAAGLLAVIAFFVAFSVCFKGAAGDDTVFTNVVIGKQYVVMGGVKEVVEDDEVFHSTYALVGIILILVAGLAAAVLGIIFGEKKWVKWVMVGLAVVMVAGAILSLFVREGYAVAMVNNVIKHGVPMTAEEKKEAIKQFNEMYKAMAVYGGGYVVPMIFGLLAGGAAVAAPFLKDKALLK